MRNRPPVFSLIKHGKDLSDTDLRAMADLRRALMQFKPEVDLQADFAGFCAFLRECTSVLLLQSNGRIVGFTGFGHTVLRTPARRRIHLIFGDYIFVDPDYRGRPELKWGMLRAYLREIAAWRGGQIWMAGVAYPASALLFSGLIGQVYSAAAAAPCAEAKSVMAWLRDEFVGARWDAQKGCVNMPTIPPPMSEHRFAKYHNNPRYREYEAACPDWTAGYALALYGRVRPLYLIAGALRSATARKVRV